MPLRCKGTTLSAWYSFGGIWPCLAFILVTLPCKEILTFPKLLLVRGPCWLPPPILFLEALALQCSLKMFKLILLTSLQGSAFLFCFWKWHILECVYFGDRVLCCPHWLGTIAQAGLELLTFLLPSPTC